MIVSLLPVWSGNFFCSSCVSVYWRCLLSFLYLMPWRVLGLPRVCVFVWLPLVQHLCCYLFYGWWSALLCVCLHSKSAVYAEYAYMCAVLICHCCIVCIWLMYLLLCVHAWHCICVCVSVCLLLRGSANVFSVRCLLCGGTQGWRSVPPTSLQPRPRAGLPPQPLAGPPGLPGQRRAAAHPPPPGEREQVREFQKYPQFSIFWRKCEWNLTMQNMQTNMLVIFCFVLFFVVVSSISQ